MSESRRTMILRDYGSGRYLMAQFDAPSGSQPSIAVKLYIRDAAAHADTVIAYLDYETVGALYRAMSAKGTETP